MKSEKEESQEKGSGRFLKILTFIGGSMVGFWHIIISIPDLHRIKDQYYITNFTPIVIDPPDGIDQSLEIDPPEKKHIEKKLKKLIIEMIQLILKQTGFDPGPIDGMLGPDTREAIRKFQTRYGLTATGKIDDKTLEALDLKNFHIPWIEDYLFSRGYLFNYEIQWLNR